MVSVRAKLFAAFVAAPIVVALLAGPPPPAAASNGPSALASAESGAWTSAKRVRSRNLTAPRFGRGAWVAKVLAPSRGRVRLKHPKTRRVIGTRTSWSKQALILMVLGSVTYRGRDWVRLRLAERPNGSAAWFPLNRMKVRRVPWWVKIRTGKRTVTVYRNGKRVRRFRAVVGARRTPTPTGLGAIYERNRQRNPHRFIGSWAVPLTFSSNVLENYGGGPGRIAIHGRGGASFADPLGSARSHGCIRIDNRPVAWIARHLPKGTPVRVVR